MPPLRGGGGFWVGVGGVWYVVCWRANDVRPCGVMVFIQHSTFHISPQAIAKGGTIWVICLFVVV